MDYMLKKYLPRIHFDSYEDFKTNYRVNVPADFNFGFDVVDGWAQEEPEKKALVWCNDSAEERIFTFQEISRISNQMCNYFRSIGIRKGDRILLILKRRYEYWITVTALHKIGAVVIPATFQLTEKDLIYRINAASVKMIICAQDENIISHVEEHSKKPDEVRERIERLMGDVPRIELFARQKADGWDVWGNEVINDVELTTQHISP